MRFAKQTFSNFLCITMLILSVGGLQLAVAGDWDNTIAAVVMNDRLYTVEKGGALYETNVSSGKWVQIGKQDFANTKFLFAGGQSLLTIESDGSLYRVSPTNGSWVQLGKSGDWKGTVAGTFLGGKLYTAESGGGLYATDSSTGVWRQIGKTDFGNTRHLFNNGDLLFSIESDGSLYRIKPTDGSWSRAKEAGGWKNTITSTVLNGKLYTVETSGALYETSLVTGAWKQIGKTEFGKTKFLFCANGWLYSIESGDLYKINPTTGAWAAVA